MSLPDDVDSSPRSGPMPPGTSVPRVRDGRGHDRPGRPDLDVGHDRLNPPSKEDAQS